MTELRVPGCEFNMAGWMAEKAGDTVKALASLVDQVREPGTPVGMGDGAQALATIRVALWHATKLWAAACGAEWTTDDASVVAAGGRRGYERLKERYEGPLWKGLTK